jgi:hypothetical protein
VYVFGKGKLMFITQHLVKRELKEMVFLVSVELFAKLVIRFYSRISKAVMVFLKHSFVSL